MVELQPVKRASNRRQMNLAGHANHLKRLFHEPERAANGVRIRPQRPRQALRHDDVREGVRRGERPALMIGIS